MRVVIAGGHGKIARHLIGLLSARGDEAVGIIRNPDHAADLEADGAEPVVLDLEMAGVDDVAQAVAGADAVVFAAGAGPGSGRDRKLTVDRDGAILLADAAIQAAVRRYVMVSSMGAGTGSPDSDDVFEVYSWAKGQADEAVRERDLDVTIVQPGGLSDDKSTGRVTVGRKVERGEISRADVALVLLAVLDRDAMAGRTFQLIGGGDEIDYALSSLA
ncbi:MAG: SDR family oxidoreductase [Actinomycetota bacterium]|nr:SDR family oxidoreductase [Actinomycetota bacterium]